MKFSIDTSALERARDAYAQFSDRRFQAGVAVALTRTAQAVQQAQVAEIRDVFDRPTAYTLRQVYMRGATASTLESRVGVSDYPYTVGYLRYHIEGGPRRAKRFESLLMANGAMPQGMRAVPGRFARLDAYGNISPGLLRQVLSQLRIEPTQGATSALPQVTGKDRRLVGSARRGSGFVGPVDRSAVKQARQRIGRVEAAYRRAGGQFVAFPNGRGKLRPGIYQVRATSFGRSDPKPIIIYVSQATYEAGRFDFHYVSRLTVDRTLPRELGIAMEDQLRRLAAKQAGQA